MKITEYLKHNILILDGGMGTLLQESGLKPGEHPEYFNIDRKDIIKEIHKSYFNAGSNVVNTNTFGANVLNFPEDELEKIVSSAIDAAKQAREESADGEKYIALDIGPTGRLLKPLGDLDFEDAVEIFAKTVRLGEKYGVDLIMIETMNDCYETKAALLAAKENSSLPVFVSNAYSDNGRLMTGASPAAMVALLEGMGADAIGINCSFGPDKSAEIIEEYLKYSSVPVILKPNAGMPRIENGKTVFDVCASDFAKSVAELVEKGVRIAGGCCGTTAEYIKELKSRIIFKELEEVAGKNITSVSSYKNAVFFGEKPLLIGERINPTGKKRLKQAINENDIEYILSEGIKQQDAGADLLDVNVGLPGIDEAAVLTNAVTELQTVTDLPLQIDTALPAAMERAVRRYNGKPLINSVNGKEESMQAVFPIVKKYGGTVIALTLDENGIPDDADGRIKIAEKIIKKAKEYGIEKNCLVFDALVMSVSAMPDAAKTVLETTKRLRNELGVYTSLGVSNVSFGLPERENINSVFFAAALNNGLNAAIMNPFSEGMMRTYYSYLVLAGLDENCQNYINFATNNAQETAAVKTDNITLCDAVIKGFKESAAQLTEAGLENGDPLELVNNEIIPALDSVGKMYEQGKVFLPQLLISAEAAKSAFEVIKSKMTAKSKGTAKCKFVIATVKGDIHDIGKNIVKLILENYGFDVIDLGKDVAPEIVVDTAVEHKVPIVGLSALMTTTVPAMEETIKLLRKKAPWCKVVVGGAVLNREYAESIGADKYAKDAMDTVRYAEEINKNL